MSAQVLVVSALCGLAVAAAAVILPALPAAQRRVKSMQEGREDRQRTAAAIVAMPHVEPSRTDRTGADVAANWTIGEQPTVPFVAGDEAQVWAVERPPGDTQEWEVQERVVPAEVVDEPPVEPVTVVEDEAAALFAEEPTPLFDASGRLPELPADLDPSTVGWNRAALLERIRRAELALAQSAPKPETADEEMAA